MIPIMGILIDRNAYQLINYNLFYSGMNKISKSYFLVSILISKCYLYFHLTQIIISLAVLFSLIVQKQTLAVTLEITACLLLGFDIQLRCAAEGIEAFIKSLFVIIVCTIIVNFVRPKLIQQSEEDIPFAILVVRYSIQFWRVIKFSQESKKQLQINKLEEINFSNISTQDNDSSIHI